MSGGGKGVSKGTEVRQKESRRGAGEGFNMVPAQGSEIEGPGKPGRSPPSCGGGSNLGTSRASST